MTAEPTPRGRDRLRELLDAVLDGSDTGVEGMARKPQSLWLDGESASAPDVDQLMLAHDIADTRYLLGRAAELTEDQWLHQVSPGQTVLEWDGPEPSVGAVLGAAVWTKEVWLASIEGRDFPGRDATDPTRVDARPLAVHHDEIGAHWTATLGRLSAEGRMGDTVIDALCDPPESFQLHGIVAHVLTFSAHRRQLVRGMLAELGVATHRGDPLE